MWKFPKIEKTKTRQNSASFIVFSGLFAPKIVWYMGKQSLCAENSTDRCEKLTRENSYIYILCFKGKIYPGGVQWLLNRPLQRLNSHKSKINNETER